MRRLYERGAPELGIRNFEFLFILGFACVFELFNLELAVLTGIHIFLTRRHEHRFHPINSKWAIHNAPWRTIQKSPLGFAACLSKNSKFLIRTAGAVRQLVFFMFFLLLAQWCSSITHDIVWRMGVESNALVKPIRQTISWTRRVWQQKVCG